MANAKKSYWEKLKDPRWQKLRLEVMHANNFTCEICGDSESPLNVHHKEYFKGLDPWEYEKNQLAVLCEGCHEQLHDEFDVLKWVCSVALLDGPGNRTELAMLLSGYLGIDYQGVLSISCLDDFPAYKNAHMAGVKAKTEFDGSLSLLYQSMKDKNNG